MKLLFLLTFLFSLSTLAQVPNLFETYMDGVNSGSITESNSLHQVRKSEVKLFENISVLFDELQVSMDEVGYISPKDKVREFANGWKTHSKDQKLKKLLKRLAEDPKLALRDPSIPKLLKDNRKFCQFLRESFYIFDKDHTAPSQLEKVVKPFGKLNDAIVAGNPNLIEEYSKKVLKNYKKLDTELMIKEFDFISKSEFDDFYKVIKKEAKDILAKPVQTVHDFHNLRKLHKKFSYIYIAVSDGMSVEKSKVLSVYIDQLGDLNDIYVDMKMRLGVDLDSHIIKIDESVKRNMNRTMSFLEADMINVKLGPSCYSAFKSL